MLKYTAENLLEEATSAEAHAKKHISSFADIIQTYVGSYYRDDMRPVNPSPENYPYSYVANVRPRLVFNNPRFNATSEATNLKADQILMQAKFVNRWAVQENLSKILIPFVTQALMLRSVILTSFEDEPNQVGLPETAMRRKMPKCNLLEPHRYFRDPVSTPATNPRFKGHIWVRDLEDVKKMKGVSKDTLAKLVPDIELRKLQRPNSNQGNGEMPARLEILAYEIWVPECNDYATQRGHNGTIFTVAVGQSVTKQDGTKRTGKGFLLAPRPFYGPEWGPYTELEYVDVPGQTYGTSPVAVVMQQVEELNAHLSATADAAARMKNLILIDAANDVLQLSVQNSPDGSVIGIPNLTKDAVVQAVIGGPAKEQYEYNEVSRQRLDRNIGMDAAQRGGDESSDKTATASNIRYETMNIRMADLKRITAAAVKQIANTVSWYGWESNNVVMKLGEDAGEEMGMKNPVYFGGPEDGEKLPPWDACALQLEPMSMEAVDEDKLAQQVMEALALITQMAQEMQTAPWLGYDVILAQLAKLRKFDWLEEAINSEMFAAWMKEQVQQQMEAHQAEQAMQAAQVEQIKTQTAMQKLEMALRIAEMQQGSGEEKKGPSVSISYKDLPEDVKRQAEAAAGFSPSTQPLTSPAHVSNAVDLQKTREGMQHKSKLQTQTHQHQRRQSELSNMFKASAGGAGKSGGMRSRSSRAQVGPAKTAHRGQKAFAESR